MINVSELITDSDFCQPNGIQITRRPYKVVNHKPTNTELKIKMQGIITIAEELNDEMLPEADRNKEAINVFTLGRLFTTGVDKKTGNEYMADIVTFEGLKYKVAYCLNDAQYGFCRSKAIRMSQEDM